MLGIRQARTGSCRLLGADMSSGGAGGASSSSGGGGGSSGAPCGACKFLRRKCVKGCIFAPYFGSEQGAARFAAVHKIFGASNVSKLLLQIPSLKQRCDAVLTISYEAQARLSDPVYGCVATIFALQQQVAGLQTELAIVQAQLASRLAAIQQQQQHSLSASAASMYDISSLGASSSTNKEDYLQVQAAAAGGLHNFDLGVPIQQSMESSTHKSCKGRMSQDAEELQALLCRK